MDTWLTAHQPWLNGPWGYAVLAGVVLVPMVFVAARRSAGFDTYWRMPLHILVSSSSSPLYAWPGLSSARLARDPVPRSTSSSSRWLPSCGHPCATARRPRATPSSAAPSSRTATKPGRTPSA